MSPDPVVHWATAQDDHGWFLMVKIDNQAWRSSPARFPSEEMARAFCDHVASLVEMILDGTVGIKAQPIHWTN